MIAISNVNFDEWLKSSSLNLEAEKETSKTMQNIYARIRLYKNTESLIEDSPASGLIIGRQIIRFSIDIL